MERNIAYQWKGNFFKQRKKLQGPFCKFNLLYAMSTNNFALFVFDVLLTGDTIWHLATSKTEDYLGQGIQEWTK